MWQSHLQKERNGKSGESLWALEKRRSVLLSPHFFRDNSPRKTFSRAILVSGRRVKHIDVPNNSEVFCMRGITFPVTTSRVEGKARER